MPSRATLAQRVRIAITVEHGPTRGTLPGGGDQHSTRHKVRTPARETTKCNAPFTVDGALSRTVHCHMDGRLFLRGLGLAGIAPVLSACTRTLRLTPDDVMATPDGGPHDGRDPHGVWQEGAAYARWAPSPHNVQPWLLRV